MFGVKFPVHSLQCCTLLLWGAEFSVPIQWRRSVQHVVCAQASQTTRTLDNDGREFNMTSSPASIWEDGELGPDQRDINIAQKSCEKGKGQLFNIQLININTSIWNWLTFPLVSCSLCYIVLGWLVKLTEYGTAPPRIFFTSRHCVKPFCSGQLRWST